MAKAEVRISATVNKETVAINKNLQLTIAIQSTSNIDAPTIPKMKDFDIYSSGQNRKMSWVNGKTSYYVQFSYTLTPKKIGKAQIPSIIIFEGNKKRFTSPINIQVIKPNAPTDPVLPSPNSNVGMIDSDTGQEPYQKAAPKIDDLVFLTAKTNKKTAYINEQINVNLKFYTAIPLINNPHYTPPKLEGFISEDLPPVRNGRVNLKGRIYYYNEIKSALFAIDAGAAIINPATIDALIQTSNPNDLSSSGFFQSFFSGRRGEKKRVKSKKIKIKILPLPEKGKPASFNGAVGEYKISA
ncbi:MAG: BatD family protein, partial [Elusimicrobiota bacterium]|nr:BatD family protein [Elusimicrobiota bacterium]